MQNIEHWYTWTSKTNIHASYKLLAGIGNTVRAFIVVYCNIFKESSLIQVSVLYDHHKVPCKNTLLKFSVLNFEQWYPARQLYFFSQLNLVSFPTTRQAHLEKNCQRHFDQITDSNLAEDCRQYELRCWNFFADNSTAFLRTLVCWKAKECFEFQGPPILQKTTFIVFYKLNLELIFSSVSFILTFCTPFGVSPVVCGVHLPLLAPCTHPLT